MLDGPGLELLAQRLKENVGEDVVRETILHRGQAMLDVDPEKIHEVLSYLKDGDSEPYDFLASLHGCDYLPAEPRLAVHYQLLSRSRCERLGVRVRMGIEEANVRSVCDIFPTAEFQEREVYDFFGIDFEGHPDPRRMHMPEDYEGHPQRRDFPIGGEPVLFTFNEHKYPRWYE